MRNFVIGTSQGTVWSEYPSADEAQRCAEWYNNHYSKMDPKDRKKALGLTFMWEDHMTVWSI